MELILVSPLDSAVERELSSHPSETNYPNPPAPSSLYESFARNQSDLVLLSTPSPPRRSTSTASPAALHPQHTVSTPTQTQTSADFEASPHRPGLRASHRVSNASLSASGSSGNSGSSIGTANSDSKTHLTEMRERLFSEPSSGRPGSSRSPRSGSRSGSNGEDEKLGHRVIKQRSPLEPEDLDVVSPTGKRRSSIVSPSPEEGYDSSSVHAWDSVVS